MNDDRTGPGSFEIPGEMRNFAEQSVDQARRAFESFIAAAEKAASAVEGQAAAAQSGARDMGRQAMAFAEKNVSNAFDFAQRLVRAKDPEEVMRLQTEFAQAQLRVLTEQAQELGQAVSRSVAGAAKPKG